MASPLRVAVSVLLSISVDLSLLYASGYVAASGALGNLARLWVCAALRCLALTTGGVLAVGRVKPLLLRLAAVHGSLLAVFESGSRALHAEGSRCGFQADARCWLVSAGASLAAAVFWELTFPEADGEDNDESKKQESRKLFVRVLVLYKPFYRLLAGGFLFLSLAVACELPADGGPGGLKVLVSGVVSVLR